MKCNPLRTVPQLSQYYISHRLLMSSCLAQMRTICPTIDGEDSSLSMLSARRDTDILTYVPPTWPFAMRPGFTHTVDPTSYSHTTKPTIMTP